MTPQWGCTWPSSSGHGGLFEETRDLFEAGMVRLTDSEVTAMKEVVYPHRSLETGGTGHQAGPHRKAPGRSGGRGNEGEMWARVLNAVCLRRNRQDRVSELRVGLFGSFQWSWGTEPVLSCPVSGGPGVIRTENGGPECESRSRRWWCELWIGWVAYERHPLHNWVPTGRNRPESARPQRSKQQIQKLENMVIARSCPHA